MATPNTLPRPGVKVFTEFRTVSPTVVTPSMPACVIGVAKEIVEAITNDGSLNADTLIALPARIEFPFVSTPFQYATLGALTLQISVNNGPTQTITFPASPANPTVAEVRAYINSLAIPGLLVDVESNGAQQRIVLRTLATGPFASLSVAGGTGLTVLNLRSGGYAEVGRGGYNNYNKANFGLPNYPDPRDNLEDLTIDYDTARVFIATGGGLFVEVDTESTFLRGGTAAVSVFDDGDGDNLSPYLTFAGQNFTDGAAAMTGTVDWTTLTYPAAFGVLTLEVIVDGVTHTVTFASPGNAAAAIGEVNTQLSGFATAVLNGSNQPVITSLTSGPGSSVEIGTAGTINETTIGLAAGTYVAGRRSRARHAGSVDLSGLTYGSGGPFASPGLSLIMSFDGEAEQTLLIGPSIASAAALVTAINAKWQVPSGLAVASLNGNNNLVLRSPTAQGGEESVLRINSLSSSLATLGLTAGRYVGNAYAPEIGDEVYGDGVRLGIITEVAPAGVVTRLRLDVELLLTRTWVNFYIKALGLTGPATSTRPSADLIIDSTSGEVLVKHEIFRSPAGLPSAAVDFGLYLGFTALRRDVAAGADASILRIGGLDALEAQLSPINPENPLGLGMYFAMLNAPGLETFGLGVGEASVDEVYGTLGAWAEAFEFIESKDVYGIAILSHAAELFDLSDAHVTAMSDPEVGLERAVFLNPSRPTRQANTIVGSGSLGNSTGAVSTFDTGLVNLPALLAAVGHPAPPYDIDDRIVLRMDDDTNNYLVTGVSGSQVTVSTGALSAGTDEDNTDGFYFDGSSPAFPSPIVDRPFTIFVRGLPLANLTEEAIAYAAIPQGYQNRRMVFVTPDQARATIDGLEQAIEGFYLCAALAGATAAKHPAAPMTEVGIRGFTGLIGASDRYGEIQYRIMDGGGLWNLYQEAANQPVKTRHQLTSAVATIETREFSILTALDFVAKFYRAGLRNFVGRFNITTNLLAAASTATEGLNSFLTSNDVVESIKVERLLQNPDAKDGLVLDLSIGVYYPCNEIKVTLII